MPKTLYIGIDDTDSKRTMCTTYVAAMALKVLEEKGYRRADYPWLVRLNPNCPFKTRGNAALCIVLKVDETNMQVIEDTVAEIVERYADLESDGTDPGIVYVPEEKRGSLIEHYWRTLREIIDLEEAYRLCSELDIKYKVYKEGRGIVGALAAAGADVSTLKTYELIAYRTPENWGKPRRIDRDSVIKMDLSTRPFTFDNYDYDKDCIRIAPNTPCPVLLGVRSIDDKYAVTAYNMLKIGEPVAFFEIFKTNQATDLHYVRTRIKDVVPLQSVVITGRVASSPRVIEGGHVFIEMEDNTGRITLAAYEPTGNLRKVIAELIPGDTIEVYGAVKLKPQGITLNIEKLKILDLAPKLVFEAPTCPRCGRKMKSLGREKGYRCSKCELRMSNMKPISTKKERKITIGTYDVAVSARRHLVSPSYLTSLLTTHDEHS
ncbi:MAG: tRNA(Ile)(2)-agmatinylcytidine synthase [Halobacteria archaeon]